MFPFYLEIYRIMSKKAMNAERNGGAVPQGQRIAVNQNNSKNVQGKKQSGGCC